MFQNIRRVFVIFFLIILTGCTKLVVSDVVIRSYFGQKDFGKSVYIEPFNRQDDRFYPIWEDILRTELYKRLAGLGLKIESERAKADLTLAFEFNITREVTEHPYRRPLREIIGYDTHTTVTIDSQTGTRSEKTTREPIYATTGFETGVTTTIQFVRDARIMMLRRESEEFLWGGELQSIGGCGRADRLVPIFLDAFFRDFPSRYSGTIRSTDLKDC